MEYKCSSNGTEGITNYGNMSYEAGPNANPSTEAEHEQLFRRVYHAGQRGKTKTLEGIMVLSTVGKRTIPTP